MVADSRVVDSEAAAAADSDLWRQGVASDLKETTAAEEELCL